MVDEYHLEINAHPKFANMKDADRIARLYRRTMRDLGHPGEHDHFAANVYWKDEGREKHEVNLMFSARCSSKAKALKFKQDVLNVMHSILKRFGFKPFTFECKNSKQALVASLGWGTDDDGVYFELERMMDTRIDCRTVAA